MSQQNSFSDLLARLQSRRWPWVVIAFLSVALVVIACIVSMAFLGRIEGVREGTVAAALCVGLIAKRIGGPVTAFADKYLS